MLGDPLFRCMDDDLPAAKVSISFNGRSYDVPRGVSVATALLLIGVDYTRETPVTGAKRAPFCMMGVCFECLVEIDGKASQQGCLVIVRDGMQIDRQHGAASMRKDDRAEPPAAFSLLQASSQ